MIGNINFNLPKDKSSMIKVIGVGGGGSNVVNRMYALGISNVDLVVCNTDNQALDYSKVPNKIRLGSSGLGAGGNPELGKQYALESKDQIYDALQANTKMLFLTVGMGGGTGTGASPVIAQIARELNILIVGIVTLPYKYEGPKRTRQALDGIKELSKYVDTMIVIPNDKLKEVHGNEKFTQANALAQQVPAIAAKSIADIITEPGIINVDFEDVNTVLKGSGTALMGYAEAEGDNRAAMVVKEALSSPLLNDNDIKGATDILLSIVSGEDEVTEDELCEISEYVQDAAGNNANCILGHRHDSTLGNKIAVTVIATGFKKHEGPSLEPKQKVVYNAITGEKVIEQTPIPVKTDEIIPTTNLGKSVFIAQKEEDLAQTTKFQNRTSDYNASHDEVNNPATEEKSRVIRYSLYDEINNSTRNVVSPQETKKEELDSDKIVLIHNRLHRNDVNLSNNNDRSSLKDSLDAEITLRKRQEKVAKLQHIAVDLRSIEQIERLEKQPAYLRKEVAIPSTPASNETMMSGKSLCGNKIEKRENDFVHPNVD